MSWSSSVVRLAAVAAMLVAFSAPIVSSPAKAEPDERPSKARAHACPAPATATIPKYRLNDKDQIAAWERVQYALSEVSDGATLVWHRWHGHLSALVQPTSSFKDRNGTVCRHLIVVLTSGKRTKRTEGIACRLPDGRWRLDG